MGSNAMGASSWEARCPGQPAPRHLQVARLLTGPSTEDDSGLQSPPSRCATKLGNGLWLRPAAIMRRLHQEVSREAVTSAYGGLSGLPGPPESLLLDAEHIIADNRARAGHWTRTCRRRWSDTAVRETRTARASHVFPAPPAGTGGTTRVSLHPEKTQLVE